MNLLQPNQLLKSIVLVFGIVCLTSCSSKPESLKIIPKDTSIVSVIDVFSLARKGELYNLKDFKFFKTLRKEIRNESKKASGLMDDMMKDPRNTGLDFTSDIFMFYINDARDEKFGCMSADLSNAEKFQDFLKNMLEKAEVTYEIVQQDKFKFTIINRDVAIGWDADKVVFMSAQGYSSRENLDLALETLFELNDDNQITSKDEFLTFYDNKEDMSVWFASDMLADMPAFSSVQNNLGYDIADNYLSLYLDFEDDLISLKTQITPNDELAAKMDKYDIWDKDFNSDLLDYLPKQNFATASMSVNPIAYYDLMSQENDFETINEGFSKEAGFEMQDFVASFEGSMVVSLSDFETVESRYGSQSTLPVMGVALDMNTDKYIKLIIDKLPEGELENKGDYYEMLFSNEYPVYMAFNDDACLFTNDKAGVKAFKGGGLKNGSLGDTDMASIASNSGYYARMNLDFSTYPTALKKEMEKLQSNSTDSKAYKLWNDFADSMEMRQVDDYSMEFRMNTKSNGKNSLRSILELIDNNYSEFMAL